MLRVALTIALVMSASVVWGLGDQPLIDPEQQKVDVEKGQKIAECQKKLKEHDYAAKLECVSRVNYEYQKKGADRGTQEYFETHSKKLGTPELIKLREILIKQKRTARFSTEADRDPDGKRAGELTKETLQNDIIFIELELQDRKAHRKQ